MCLNCGCGMPDDDMGNQDNITLTDLAKAAIASKMSAQDTLKVMKDALGQISVEELEQKIDELKNKNLL